jgi:hypothetical protein
MDAPVRYPLFDRGRGRCTNEMGAQRPKNVKKNNINYHLSRMYPNIVGPRKRK